VTPDASPDIDRIDRTHSAAGISAADAGFVGRDPISADKRMQARPS